MDVDYAEHLLQQDSAGFKNELGLSTDHTNIDDELDIDALLEDGDGPGGLVGAKRDQHKNTNKTAGRYSQKSPVTHLMTAWVNEEAAPDILPYQPQLVSKILQKLKYQETAMMDISGPMAALTELIYSQEIERIKYMLKCYLKVRLKKIEKYALFVLSKQEYRERLSRSELEYAERFQILLQTYLKKSCLDFFPETLRSLEETQGTVSMIDQPDNENCVFICVLETIGMYRLEDRNAMVDLQQDDIHLIRYSSISRLLEDNKVVLL